MQPISLDRRQLGLIKEEGQIFDYQHILFENKNMSKDGLTILGYKKLRLILKPCLLLAPVGDFHPWYII